MSTDEEWKCPCCNEKGTITCTSCKSVKYCSPECQFSDFSIHFQLCSTFKDFQDKDCPQPDMVRALLFPADGVGPRWVWVPKRLCNCHSGEELKAYLGKAQSEELEFNEKIVASTDNVLRNRLQQRMEVLINHSDDFGGPIINNSVVHFTLGQLGFRWSADILVFRGGWAGGDISMEDITGSSNFMTHYHNNRPEHAAAMELRGRKVQGIKIRCDGEAAKHQGDKFPKVTVSPTSWFFDTVRHGKADQFMAQVAVRVNLPIITLKFSPFLGPETTAVGYRVNQAATSMHKVLDPTNGFGDALPWWSHDVGDVIIVRQDRKPLARYVVEAFCDFCLKHLDPLFQCVRAGGLYEGLPVTKEQLLSRITPDKWEVYLKEWKIERGGQDAETDGEDSDLNGDCY